MSEVHVTLADGSTLDIPLSSSEKAAILALRELTTRLLRVAGPDLAAVNLTVEARRPVGRNVPAPKQGAWVAQWALDVRACTIVATRGSAGDTLAGPAPDRADEPDHPVVLASRAHADRAAVTRATEVARKWSVLDYFGSLRKSLALLFGRRG